MSTGLRERHKADRDRRIVQAAARLFRGAGYEGTKIEAIAEAADVSIGTIYNYYQNKGDLLVAIVALEVNEVLNAGDRHIAADHDSVAGAVNGLVAIYIEHSLVYLSKAMWQQAMAISIEQPQSPFGKVYGELDQRLSEQICALLQRLQAAGLIAPSADTSSAGELIFNNMDRMFVNFVKSDSMTIETVLAAIDRQHELVLASIAANAEPLSSLMAVDGSSQVAPAARGRRRRG